MTSLGAIETTSLYGSIAAAVVAIIYGVGAGGWVLKLPAGNPRMQEIAGAIQEGAAAYMNRIRQLQESALSSSLSSG
jgi:K(+)-stimulated pyrophosphate-energized sodium pump